nr:uncharacterized protein LOC108054650 [Drosophila takahashii]
MSDVPYYTFSAALNAVAKDLLYDEKVNSVPSEVEFLKRQIGKALQVVSSRQKIMGSTSEFVRKIGNVTYEMHIHVDFPFELTPIRDNDRPGFVMLKADEQIEHSAIVNGFLDRTALDKWIITILKENVLRDNILIQLGIRNPEVRCSYQEYTLVVLPVLEYDYIKWPLPVPPALPESVLKAFPWYAVPKVTSPGEVRSFLAWTPDWNRCTMEFSPHYQKVEIFIMKYFSARNVTWMWPNIKDMIQAATLKAIPKQKVQCDFADFLFTVLETLDIPRQSQRFESRERRHLRRLNKGKTGCHGDWTISTGAD